MILFLDDDPKRLYTFQSNIPSAELAATAEEMINLLMEFTPVDCLLLDHDLGGNIFVDSAEKNTGMEVVRWIKEHTPKIDRIIVHSLNVEAAHDMVKELSDAGYETSYIPFHNLDFETIRTTEKQNESIR